VELNNY